MFQPQNKNLTDFVLEYCNWTQACEWLESAWEPLPSAYEHFDKRRDNRTKDEDIPNDYSYWRRSQVLAQAIMKKHIELYNDNNSAKPFINEINIITEQPESSTKNLPILIKELQKFNNLISFMELKQTFPNGNYTIILNDNFIFSTEFYVSIKDDYLMLSVGGNPEQQIYNLTRSGVMKDILKYLITIKPNKSVTYEELRDNIPELKSGNVKYNEYNIHSIRDKFFQNLRNRKISKLDKNIINKLEKLFLYKGKRLTFITHP